MIPNLKCRYILIFWVFFLTWFVYSYFLGDNSLISYNELKDNYRKLKKEEAYWKNLNSIYEQKISSFKRNKEFYYEKLAREMFLKYRNGEKVILFVKPQESER